MRNTLFFFLLLVFLICVLPLYSLWAFTQHFLYDFKYFSKVFCDYSWERENTQNIKELVSASRGKKKKKKLSHTASVSKQGGRIDWVCWNIKHVAVHLENTGCLVLFGSKTIVQHRVCAVLFSPLGWCLENTHMHSIEQVFHRQRKCEGQQSLPGVPERVETTTPWSNVSWRKKRQSVRKYTALMF